MFTNTCDNCFIIMTAIVLFECSASMIHKTFTIHLGSFYQVLLVHRLKVEFNGFLCVFATFRQVAPVPTLLSVIILCEYFTNWSKFIHLRIHKRLSCLQFVHRFQCFGTILLRPGVH